MLRLLASSESHASPGPHFSRLLVQRQFVARWSSLKERRSMISQEQARTLQSYALKRLT